MKVKPRQENQKKKIQRSFSTLERASAHYFLPFFSCNHVFSQPDPLQSLSLLLLITNISTQWGPIFRKEAARFSGRLGALGITCENIRFSSLFAAGDVSRGGTSATQRQKFHTDDANQCLRNKSGGHGVPNLNLSNFTFRGRFWESVVFICQRTPAKLKCFF